MFRANSSPGQYNSNGQYLVVDQSQRFPVNNSKAAFPFYPGNQPPFNLLPSNSLINTNQLNSSLNGNPNNLASFNTQDKNKQSNFPHAQLASSNPSTQFYSNLSGVTINEFKNLI